MKQISKLELQKQKWLTFEKSDEKVVVDIKNALELSKGIKVTMFTSAGFTLNKDTLVYEMPYTNAEIKSVLPLKSQLEKRGYIVVDHSGILEKAMHKQDEVEELKWRIQKAGEIKKNPTTTKLSLGPFKRDLKDFQQNIVKHSIVAKHSANFSCPGSGKTTMIYATYSHQKYIEKVVNKILVVCPINAFEAWETEYVSCFNNKPNSIRLNGQNRRRGYDTKNDYELYLINHATLTNDIDEIIRLLKSDNFMLVLDESHYVKNFSEQATWANSVLNISSFAKIRLISSGTPAPNSEYDFWSQFTFLMGTDEILGNRTRYMTNMSNDYSKLQVLETINSLSHRVTKGELDLPKTIFIPEPVEMAPIQKRLYELIANQIIDEVSNLNVSDTSIYLSICRARLIRLRQISSNPALLIEAISEIQLNNSSIDNKTLYSQIVNYPDLEISSKIAKTIEIATRLIKDKKRVVIWCDFVLNIKYLYEYFTKNNIKTFHVFGEIPKEATDEVGDVLTREGQIAAFKENEASILIANPQTMAEAVSLHHECHSAIYMDRSFNCAHWMQSKDRIHRVGLPENTLTEYYIIQNENSIDEVINQRLNEKETAMNRILANEIPVATGEFNGRDFGEEDDFLAVLAHLKQLRGE
ncbi:DEAD/DEAH box helicase [Sporosarcina sp. NPDC096371]|uniref:DEAD/DEAH box helicase n=1 Tax=Sporosarcina sp. NPDC096371 TaxID=3364530 RepID=UPI0037F42C43